MQTYPLVPNKITVLKSEFKTTIIKFESGAEQRSPDRHTPIRRYKLTHDLLSYDDMDDLREFYEDRKGSFQAFLFSNYLDSVGTTQRVRFVSDTLEIEEVSRTLFNVSVEIQTC